MRIYPEGFNQNTNKELNKVSLKGDIGKADVRYINIYKIGNASWKEKV